MQKQIIMDGLSGFVMFALLSYFTEKNKNNDYYFKVAAFLWAAPFTYFYLQYIASKNGKKQLFDFNRHALFGTSCTIFLILASMFFHKSDVKFNIMMSFCVTLIFAFIYFYYKLFNKF